jgi:hypothetical protein
MTKLVHVLEALEEMLALWPLNVSRLRLVQISVEVLELQPLVMVL